MKVALLCGGPSLERGISLNSARSVLDHLSAQDIEVVPIYFDHKKRAYKLSPAQLYSNTPSDFDFKLEQTGTALTQGALVAALKAADIAFPVMHGAFGEDGGVQAFLEKHDIPFVGSGSAACRRAFDKHSANEYIASRGFFTLPSVVLKIYKNDHKKILTNFFTAQRLKRAVVKPATGGSSIGVFSVSTAGEALEKAQLLFSKRMDTRVVVEPFAQGIEFTTIILQNRFGVPVAIVPTEIETDYTEHQIFDFRKKYLPTRQVTYHCPPRFSNEVIEKIQVQAEQLFAALGMRDFARFDGWVLPSGEIWFSDFNPISGMEQNSFLFQQAARVGLTHANVLRFILRRACERYGISLPAAEAPTRGKKPVSVLFGGATSERQVSLMSGTNVWLKLKRSTHYDPQPFLLDSANTVWQLPYAYTLNHTVEEIVANCKNAQQAQTRLGYLEQKVWLKLAYEPGEAEAVTALPTKQSLAAFIASSKFVFIALHGGAGENGVLQGQLQRKKVTFNGSGKEVSALCMDKWETNNYIKALGVAGLSATVGVSVRVAQIKQTNILKLWKKLQTELEATTLIVKPRADGCSSGVVHLYTPEDLQKYVHAVEKKQTSVPKGTFTNQTEVVDMPQTAMESLLFERFVETDIVRVKGNSLKHYKSSGWIEVTVGVVEEGKKLHVLNPSLTVAEGEVLSVEEKFQGGTGVNITPPPASIVSNAALQKTKKLIGVLAQKIGIQGYARIDAFMHTKTGNLIIIEINTLPGLTPSTVLYQQGLAEKPPLFPRQLLERFIKNKGY